MTPPILNSLLAEAPWTSRATGRLPGVQPLDPADWLRRDEVFAAQMGERDRLIRERPGDVIAALPGSEAAVAELLAMVLGALRQDVGYRVGMASVQRPDGVSVDLSAPLVTLGRLVQGDFCVMERDADGLWRLTAGVLCFPASWTLVEKLGRPMAGIHGPVAQYDADLDRRISRMFDAIRVEQPVWRVNALRYADPELFQPRTEAAPRQASVGARYVRSERQTLRRLPRSGAVAFGIHTRVLPLSALDEAGQRALGLPSEEG